MKLSTFAARRIRGNVIDYLRKNLPLTRRELQMKKTVEETVHELRQSTQRRPTLSELANETGIAPRKLFRLFEKLHAYGYNTDFYSDPETMPIKEPSVDGTLEKLLKDETRNIVRNEMLELDSRSRTVIMLHYAEELTLKQIGAVLGLGESRASQLHVRAIAKLRRRLAPKIDQLFLPQ